MELFVQFSSFSPLLLSTLLAALCGAIVGFEREIRDKPAGLKTNTLICVGAAMYVYLGKLLVQDSGGDPPASLARSSLVWGSLLVSFLLLENQ